MSSAPPPDDPLAPPPSPPPGLSPDIYIPGHVLVPVDRSLDEYEPAPQRRRVLPLLLFLLCCFTTFAAGVYNWNANFISLDELKERLQDPRGGPQHLQNGLIYMAAVMLILMAHEMGHFLMTLRYRIPASFPFFIPMPITITGTMGAVIGMQGLKADRRQLFDIGIAGPLAGLVLILPILCLGLFNAEARPMTHGDHLGKPLLVKLLLPVLRPDIGPDEELLPNALYMAGWVGLIVTGLNMLPVSQLDGGHVAYGLLGRRSRWLARGLLLFAIGFMIWIDQYTMILMVVLVTFLGADHPRTANDNVRIGPLRWTIGLLSLVLPILCFTPFIMYSN